MLKKLLLLLPMLLILTALPLLSQEAALDNGGQTELKNSISGISENQPSVPDNGQLYVITAFEFDIKGRTRPYALIHAGEFREGETLHGLANLEKYITDKTQILINQRVLKDNASMSYSIGAQSEDGAYPVIITIKVEDSWNFIVLPKPGYSTNTGFELIAKARDYNFLGTMNPLRIDLGYYYDEDSRHSFMLGVYSSTPFRALGYTWNIKFDNTFNYRPQVDEPYYYQNITGLSVEVPFRTTTFTFGFEESVNLNEENSDGNKEKYGDFQNGLYMSTSLFTSWEIPTGLIISRFGELTYTPGISATFNHELPEWYLQEIRRGPFLNFNHSLGFEKIDWHANYREGLSVSVSNSFSYDFFRLYADKNPLSFFLSVNGTGHLILSKFFAISSRLMYRQWFYHDPKYYLEAGDVLRGIADKALCADYMLSLNMDFPLRVLLFLPSGWLHNNKYRFFDFELHVSPVIDLALYHDPGTRTSFNIKNLVAAGGFEFIVFPLSFRSLYIRLGFAWDLKELLTKRPIKLPTDEKREIYLMMGHFY